jgi:hypothetical protein
MRSLVVVFVGCFDMTIAKSTDRQDDLANSELTLILEANYSGNVAVGLNCHCHLACQ